jgi:hypothetical protein
VPTTPAIFNVLRHLPLLHLHKHAHGATAEARQANEAAVRAGEPCQAGLHHSTHNVVPAITTRDNTVRPDSMSHDSHSNPKKLLARATIAIVSAGRWQHGAKHDPSTLRAAQPPARSGKAKIKQALYAYTRMYKSSLTSAQALKQCAPPNAAQRAC